MIETAEIPGTGTALCMAGVASPPAESCPGAVFLRQLHGSVVLANPEPGSGADGMILPRKGTLYPGMLTADCLPVFVLWEETVGCAHVGWRGLAAGILDALIKAGGGQPSVAVFGPCICGECYTVGDDVRSQITGSDDCGHLPGRLDLRLAAAAFFSPCTLLYSVDRCTLCGPGFHSHRRNGTTLRNRIWLAPCGCRRDIRASVSIDAKPYPHSGRRPA